MSRALAILLACVVVAPSTARAHAVVTRASLRDTTVVADTATTVTLEFNSAIEAPLAKVTLVDAAGAERVLEQAPGDHPKQTLVVALPPLAAGPYALRYKVLAADGHVTESVLRFEVQARP
jgi:hypothetical protein